MQTTSRLIDITPTCQYDDGMNRATLLLTPPPWAWVAALLTTLFLATACIRPEPAAAPLPITSTALGAGDQLLASWAGSALVLDLTSEKGIGQATMTMTANLPLTATLRLHLTGLEHLQVSNGITTLVVQVSSQGEHAISQTLAAATLSAAAAMPIDQAHPMWLTIEPRSAANPYYTVILPPAFLAEIKQTLTIEWIDFYR